MKNQTRINQLLTVLLLLCVLFVCMAGTAMAAEECDHVFADGKCSTCGVMGGYCGAETNEGGEQSVTWTLADNHLVITGTGAMADYTSSTRPWADYCDSVTNLVIEDGVTAIGNFSFYECKYLTSVEMPDSVTSIGKSAFSKCAGLTSLDLSDNVTFIGREAFYGCTGLTSLTIPASVTEMNNAFFGCSGLTDITISYGVTSIHDAFNQCTGLTSITIPDSVTSISGAFDGCTGLESIVVPDSVTEMDYAFDGCTGLRSANIPSSVTSIEGTFSRCISLTSIEIPDSVTSIGMYAFYSCTGLTSIEIPDSVTTIGDYAFSGCTGLESVAIPNSVTVIGFNAFVGCTQVSTVIISCTPNNAVYYCIYENFRRAERIYVHAYENGVCTDCGEPCPGHTGGEATCTEKAVCTICGTSYGEVGGHTPDENGYTVSDGTHSYSCSGCGVTVTEPHTYDDEDGTCVCSAVKTYTITLRAGGAKIVEINGEAVEILHGGTFTVPHGQELTVKFANTVSQKETGVRVSAGNADYPVFDFTYDEATNIMTIPASVVDQVGYIGVDAYVRVQFNLHGGALTKDGEREFNRFGGAWDEETATLKVYYNRLLDLEPEYFQLDGHTFAGAKVDGSDEVVQSLSFTGDATVDILWQCDTLTHVPAKDATCTEAGNIAHYTCTCDKLYAEDKTTVLTADEVKIDVDPDNHDFDPATGVCTACGAVKTYTVTFNRYGDSGAKIVEINGEAKEILPGETFTVPHGQELTVKFENTLSTQETGVYCDGYVVIDPDLIMCNYNEATNTLIIPGSQVTGDIDIFAAAYVRVQFNLHGGTLSEYGEGELEESFGFTWVADTSTLKATYGFSSNKLPDYFQLAGHTLAGVKVNGSDEVVQLLSIRSDMTVDILWQCDGTAILTPVPAKDATCTEAGNIAHY
ncbi:MAG: leucine-rich repeat domain-containing protein, partial [Oscillospiraceae bacterium]|nr:leucine-rich repeat domain-containing protein [Oscillospiraceae bacterium]